MAFRFDKLTIKAQEAVQRAQELAADRGNPQIEPLHLLAGLLDESEGVVAPAARQDRRQSQQLERIVAGRAGAPSQGHRRRRPQPRRRWCRCSRRPSAQADAMKDEFVSTEHLLLALAKVDSKAKNVLKLNAIGESDVLKALQAVRGSAAGRPTRTPRTSSRP